MHPRRLAGALALLLLLATTIHAAELRGPARVLDGDTLEVAGQRVRLFGIDAPEGEQPCRLDGRPWRCGDAATAALQRLVAGREVACREGRTAASTAAWWRCATPAART